MLRACYTDGALGVTSREECTGVRSAALLNSVYGQHRGKERLCNIRPTAMDGGMLKNIWTKVRSAALLNTVQGQHPGEKGRCNRADGDGRRRNAEEHLDEGQVRRSSYHGRRAISRKGEALQHQADGDGWEEECWRTSGRRSESLLFSPPSGGNTEEGEELQHRADGEVRRWKAQALQRFMIAMPAGGVLQTLGRPRRKAHALSPGKYWDARFAPTIVMRRAEGVLQRVAPG